MAKAEKEFGSASNASAGKRAYNVGDVTEDGWTYVGVMKRGWLSRLFGEKDHHVFAKSYDGVKPWKEAMKFAEGQNAHLGSDEELDLLQAALDKGLLKESFNNMSGSGSSGFVWGGRRDPYDPDAAARVRSLNDGGRGWSLQDDSASAVLFRSKPAAP